LTGKEPIGKAVYTVLLAYFDSALFTFIVGEYIEKLNRAQLSPAVSNIEEKNLSENAALHEQQGRGDL
jgi:hypothetical protein